ncbi:putative Type 1 galactoside alpha-(1,2)-fucosyltransferase [Dioscorea sansibarensis]
MLFTNSSPYKPSSYLIQRLRKYEKLHKKCGPNTEFYNKAIDDIKSGNKNNEQSECKYLINQPNSGLGNRMITLASCFLYALLSNRVLLTESGMDISDIFCEPFPQSSWLLPLDFPHNHLQHLSFGNMVREYSTINSTTSYVFLDLSHGSNHYDKLFFCDEYQHGFIDNITWMRTQSNQYFLPAFFLMPSYKQELDLLFPEKDTVFHHLGRYLFHPTNSAWGLITRYYSSYLANAEQRLGVQIRVFDPAKSIFLNEKTPSELVLDQIISCTLKEDLLPNVTVSVKNITRSTRSKSTSVLITSLSSEYFDKIKDMYWEKATVDGEIIRVYQPSHEEHQQTEKSSHDMKALAEMYLLSYSNVLVTSSLSTFGYVAQSLGGMKPWILSRPDKYKMLHDVPCTRALSMEPCYHAPPTFDCEAKKDTDLGLVVPHVRHCEDVDNGLKLVHS